MDAESGLGLTKSQVSTLFLFFLSAFVQSVISNMIGPLYPPEAESKGLSSYQYGLLIGVDSISNIASIPLIGLYVDRIGLRTVFLTSTFLNGLVPTVIGATDYVDNIYWYVSISVVIRILQGFLNVGIVSSRFSICFAAFQGRSSTAIGVCEAGFLFGTSVGPLLASAMGAKFGFPSSFIGVGCFQFGIGLLLFLLLPKLDNTSVTVHLEMRELLQRYWALLRRKRTFVFVLSMFLAEFGVDYVNTILEPGLRAAFKLSKLGIGLMFFAKGSLQILSPVWGYLLDRASVPLGILAVGFFISATGVGTFSPLGFIPRTPGWTAGGLVLYGLGQGMVDVGGICCFQMDCFDANESQSDGETQSIVSILYLTAASFGSFCASTMSGGLLELIGFTHTMDVLLFINAIFGAFLLLFILKDDSSKSENEECRPLLTGAHKELKT